MPIDTDKLLYDSWRNLGYKSEIPDGLRRMFKRYVVDSYLKVNVLDVDPYAEQATVQCISDYMVAESARKISRFGLSAEQLESQYRKWQSSKIAISWTGVVSLGLASACLIGFFGFLAGSIGTDSWNAYREHRLQITAENQRSKNAFLEKSHREFFIDCQNGKILKDKDGNKWCDMRNSDKAIWMMAE